MVARSSRLYVVAGRTVQVHSDAAHTSALTVTSGQSFPHLEQTFAGWFVAPSVDALQLAPARLEFEQFQFAPCAQLRQPPLVSSQLLLLLYQAQYPGAP